MLFSCSPSLLWENPLRNPCLLFHCKLFLNSGGRGGERNEDILALEFNSSPEIGNKHVIYVETPAWLSSQNTIYQNS